MISPVLVSLLGTECLALDSPTSTAPTAGCLKMDPTTTTTTTRRARDRSRDARPEPPLRQKKKRGIRVAVVRSQRVRLQIDLVGLMMASGVPALRRPFSAHVDSIVWTASDLFGHWWIWMARHGINRPTGCSRRVLLVLLFSPLSSPMMATMACARFGHVTMFDANMPGALLLPARAGLAAHLPPTGKGSVTTLAANKGRSFHEFSFLSLRDPIALQPRRSCRNCWSTRLFVLVRRRCWHRELFGGKG